MLDQRFAIDALAGRARPRNRLMRFAAAGVHDVDRRARHVRDHDGAVGGFALDLRRPRVSVAFGAGDAACDKRLLHQGDDVAVLGMDHRHGAQMSAARERVVELVIVHHQRALVGHEMLERVDAVGFDHGLHLVMDLLRPRCHRHVEAIVGGRLLGFAAPVLIRREHRLAGIGQAEIHHHRGAAGERRFGSRFEIVGGDGAHERHFEMGMRVDAARDDIGAAGVNHFSARGCIE